MSAWRNPAALQLNPGARVWPVFAVCVWVTGAAPVAWPLASVLVPTPASMQQNEHGRGWAGQVRQVDFLFWSSPVALLLQSSPLFGCYGLCCTAGRPLSSAMVNHQRGAAHTESPAHVQRTAPFWLTKARERAQRYLLSLSHEPALQVAQGKDPPPCTACCRLTTSSPSWCPFRGGLALWQASRGALMCQAAAHPPVGGSQPGNPRLHAWWHQQHCVGGS